MILYPAIDISEGKAVRLRQGSFDDVTVYGDDPLEAARSWVDAGARFLHVVDLDGARHGSPRSLHHLERIKRELGIPVQYGGGLRSLPAVRDALRAGADRVILGTAAYTDVDFLDDVVAALRRPRARRGRHARRPHRDGGVDPHDADARRGGHRAAAGPWREAVHLHERRPRRDARGS